MKTRMIARLCVLVPLLWALSLYWAYQAGATNNSTKAEAAKVPALVQAIAQHDEKADAGHLIEIAGAKRAAKTEANFQRIQRGVTDYAEQHADDSACSLDPDGLRLWREANANTDSGTEADRSRDNDAGMSQPAAAEERPEEGSAGQSRGGGEAVPQLQGSEIRPGRMAGESEVMDVTDDATRTEEEMRERSLQAVIAQAGLRGKTVADSAEACGACYDPIPQKRREAMPGVQTCITCQKFLERAMRRNAKGF